MLKTLIGVSAAILFLTHCEDKNDDKIYKAQTCLDSATPATVDNCVNIIASVNSAEAYTIRCSADFIRANITTDTILQAIDEIDNAESTTATVTFFNVFKFGTLDLANTAVTNCQRTGSSTLYDLSLAAKSATLLSSLANGADLATWVNGLDQSTIDGLSAEQLIALGETVLTLQPSMCGPGGDFEGNSVCTDLNNAVNGADAVAIAKELLNQLKN